MYNIQEPFEDLHFAHSLLVFVILNNKFPGLMFSRRNETSDSIKCGEFLD